MYEPHGKRLRQGDVAICEFHQLRARSGEPKGPGGTAAPNAQLPDFGSSQTFEIPVEVPGLSEPVIRHLRLWMGPVMVIHQSCELEYADGEDSRVLIAPIVSAARWKPGPWDLIRRGALPGYFYLPATSQSEPPELGLDGDWPDSAVVLANSTLASRGLVKNNRIFRIDPLHLSALQSALVTFSSVRGWADAEALSALKGKSIVDVQETVELVPGPSRLTKVFLADGDGSDEVTVVCGVRPTRRAA